MSTQYVPALPIDSSGNPMQEYAIPKTAKFTSASIPPAASSVVTFGSNTTAIEITALNNSLAIKWGSASVIASGATANFDHIIPVNTTRRFAIPQSVAGVTSSIVGANALHGLYNTVAVIATTTSVLSAYTEY